MFLKALFNKIWLLFKRLICQNFSFKRIWRTLGYTINSFSRLFC